MTTLAQLLARIDAEIGGLDGLLLEHHVARFACVWERHLPAIVEAVRAEQRYPGLDGEKPEPFVRDGEAM